MKFKIIFIVALVVLFTLSFQNCGRAIQAKAGSSALASIATSCFDNPSMDACIFLKSPSTMAGVGASSLSAEALPALQTYGFQIPASFDPYHLEGDVVFESSVPASGFLGSFKVPHSPENQPLLGHLMTYVWLGEAKHFLSHAGVNYLGGRGLRVVVEATQTGFASSNKTIYLKRDPASLPAAYDASLAVHLFGEANIFFATNGAAYNLSQENKHIDCGVAGGQLLRNNCCSSKRGCSKALTAGLSDHLVNLTFPQNVGVGDTFSASGRGLEICGLARNPEGLRTVTAEQAYRACSASARVGEIYAMGAFYSSIWWRVRDQVQATQPARLEDFNRFFARALALVEGRDDFVSFHTKLLQLDQAEFNSAFGALFTATMAQASVE